MKALLHVPVKRDFDFDEYVKDTLTSFSPTYKIGSRKNRVKSVKTENGIEHVGTSTGELWTWVTTHGNAVRVWDTQNAKFHRVIAVEINSRRHAVRNIDNGVGLLIANLEHLSGIQREEWDVISSESTAEEPWYIYGVSPKPVKITSHEFHVKTISDIVKSRERVNHKDLYDAFSSSGNDDFYGIVTEQTEEQYQSFCDYVDEAVREGKIAIDFDTLIYSYIEDNNDK